MSLLQSNNSGVQTLSKYTNVSLPGGLSYNGAEIYQQATDEMNQIEESLSGQV